MIPLMFVFIVVKTKMKNWIIHWTEYEISHFAFLCLCFGCVWLETNEYIDDHFENDKVCFLGS